MRINAHVARRLMLLRPRYLSRAWLERYRSNPKSWTEFPTCSTRLESQLTQAIHVSEPKDNDSLAFHVVARTSAQATAHMHTGPWPRGAAHTDTDRGQPKPRGARVVCPQQMNAYSTANVTTLSMSVMVGDIRAAHKS